MFLGEKLNFHLVHYLFSIGVTSLGIIAWRSDTHAALPKDSPYGFRESVEVKILTAELFWSEN